MDHQRSGKSAVLRTSALQKSPWPWVRERDWPPPSCHLGHRAHTWHFSSSHETEGLSDSCLKGDDISRIISWGHQGCMAVWALLVWFITLSVISFSDGWLIGQAWNSFLLSRHLCVCPVHYRRILGVSLQHVPTVNQACTPHALMICMSDCCVTNQHFPLSNHSSPRPVRAPPSGSDASLLSPNFC